METVVMIRDSSSSLCSEGNEDPVEDFVDQEVPLRKHSNGDEGDQCMQVRSEKELDEGEIKLEDEEDKTKSWDEKEDFASELMDMTVGTEDGGCVLPEDQRCTVIEDDVLCVDVASKAKTKNAPTAANTYAAKKTVAQGMMDIALITSNANQLRYLLQFGSHEDALFHFNVALIIISILLQIAIGVTLIFKGRADLSGDRKLEHANKLNNYVVGGVFLVTIINVFVSAFSIGPAAKGAEDNAD